MKIIVINGSGQTGKDSFVNFCKLNEDYHIVNLSTIDCVKNIAIAAGWDGRKDDRGRRFLSNLKDALVDYDDIPYKETIKAMESELYKATRKGIDENKVIFFIHCREPEEIQKFKDRWNAHTLLIRRGLVEGMYANHADNNVFYYDYDYTYDNNGDLNKFKNDALRFIEFIGRLEWKSEKKDLNRENFK